MIYKLFRSIKFAFHLHRAYEYFAKRENDAAIFELLKVPEDIAKRSVEVHLLKCLLLYTKDSYEQAIYEADFVIELLQSKRKYSIDEKRYLSAVAALWCARSLHQLGRIREAMVYGKYCDYDEIDLSNVHDECITNFPLPEHPDYP